MKQFNHIKSFHDSLTVSERKYLLQLVNSKLEMNNLGNNRLESVEALCCPDCGSGKLKKNGNYGDSQKYVCKECNRGFGVLSGSCVHGLHKRELWTQFIELTLESKSIREICKLLDISRQTCLDWRHKLLTSLNEAFTKEFHGIVEMDDMYMRLNQKGRRKETFIEEARRTKTITDRYGNRVSMRIKGNRKRGISNDQVAVLLSVDRYGTIGTGLLKRGKMDSKSLNSVLNNGLLSRLNNANIIVTDEAKAYVSVLNHNGFDHEHINAGTGQWTKGIYHLNTLNNADGRFKKWIKYNFSSVSTKYLHNYLGYFKMLFFVLKESGEKMEDLLKLSLTDNSSITRFRSIEKSYQTLLKY